MSSPEGETHGYATNSTETHHSKICAGEHGAPKDCGISKFLARFKDASDTMPSFVNLNSNSLRRSKWLEKLANNKPIYVDGNMSRHLSMNHSKEATTTLKGPKTIIERFFHAQDVSHTLYDTSVNQVSEFILSTVDNDLYHFKDMLNQPDRAEFITSMEK